MHMHSISGERSKGFLTKTASRVIFTNRRIPAFVKKLTHRFSPLECFYEEPIGQIFIANGEIDTYLCVNNFFSILIPEVPCDSEVELLLHNDRGETFLGRSFVLPAHGSTSISVEELLKEDGKECPLGLATCALRPKVRGGRMQRFKDMGKISSHFFTYYLGKNSEAMAIIHPQAPVNMPWTDEKVRTGWISGQVVATKGLESIQMFQANHSLSDVKVQYTLYAFPGREVIATQELSVARLSAGTVRFDMNKLTNVPPRVAVGAEPLPTPNGKPLLMRTYGNGRFSMSHS